MTDSTHPILDAWLDEWTLHLNGRIAPASVQVYVRGLRQFCEFTDATDATTVTRQHVEAWLADMAARGISPATRDVRLKSLAQFYRYVCEEEDCPDPTAKVKRVRVDPPLVEIVSDDDLRTLLATCSGKAPIDRRDNFLIRLLADAGLRRSESVGLNMDELDIGAREALVHGKGNRDRVVAFGDATALAGSRWLRARRQWADGVNPAVFVGSSGQRLSSGTVATILQRRCVAAGIEPIHPHALRHRATHTLLAAGLAEQVIEHQMGWSGGQMVRRYGRSLAGLRARDAVRDARRGSDL